MISRKFLDILYSERFDILSSKLRHNLSKPQFTQKCCDNMQENNEWDIIEQDLIHRHGKIDQLITDYLRTHSKTDVEG